MPNSAATNRPFEPTTAIVCELQLHDYLMYTSRDFGRLQVTEKQVISNYALTYALGRALAFDGDDNDVQWQTPMCFPKSSPKREPTYAEDFRNLPVYVTPAIAIFSWHKTKSYNTIPEIFQEWSVGKKQAAYSKVVPAYGRYSLVGLESRYRFTIFSELPNIRLPRYIRLGRFMASAEITRLGVCPVKRETGAFESLPIHRDDVPASMSLWGDLIMLGKRHVVVLNAHHSGEWWRLTERKVTTTRGEEIWLEHGIPVGVFYGQRSGAQSTNNP